VRLPDVGGKDQVVADSPVRLLQSVNKRTDYEQIKRPEYGS